MLKQVTCTGEEITLQECQHSEWLYVQTLCEEKAAVSCAGNKQKLIPKIIIF